MIEAIPYLIDKRKDKTSIQFIIRLKGQRLRFVPGITVETKYWIDNNRWAKDNKQYPDGYLINIQIKKYKDIIEKVLEDFQTNLVIPTQASFKKAVLERIDEINSQEGGIVSDDKQNKLDEAEKAKLFIPYAQSYKDKSTRKLSTLKSYQTTINKLIEFQEKENTVLRFEDIDITFYDKFKAFLIDQDLSKIILVLYSRIYYFL